MNSENSITTNMLQKNNLTEDREATYITWISSHALLIGINSNYNNVDENKKQIAI